VVAGGEVEDPVGDRRVDQERPDADEHHPGAEPGPVRDRPGDQGAGDHAEQPLEHGEQDHRHRRVAVRRRVEQVAQAGVLRRVTEQTRADVVSEGDRVADQGPQHRHDGEGPEGHHDHVEDALGADHAAVEERQTGGHQQHEGAGGEQPCCVARVERGRDGRVEQEGSHEAAGKQPNVSGM
jgi:hypothetical protein